MWNSSYLRFFGALALALVFGPVVSPVAAAANGQISTEPHAIEAVEGQGPLPAPLAGVRPSINLSIDQGEPGDEILISGEHPPAAGETLPGIVDGVRIFWLVHESTVAAGFAPSAADGSYSTTVTVAGDLPAGPARLCVASTRAEQSPLECLPFQIEPPEPGRVTVALPASFAAAVQQNRSHESEQAFIGLFDRQGNRIAHTPIDGPGAAFESVPPGNYTVGVVGRVPAIVETVAVQVQSDGQADVSLPLVSQCSSASVIAVRMSPTGSPSTPAMGVDFDFGTYLSFWPYSVDPTIIFEADLQIHERVAGNVPISFQFDSPSGGMLPFASVPSPEEGTTYRTENRISIWEPGIRTLAVVPIAALVIDGEVCSSGISTTRRVHIAEHPLEPSPLQSAIDRRIHDVVWAGDHYRFTVTLPNIYDRFDISLPAYFLDGTQYLPGRFPQPAPDLAYIGPAVNRFTPAFLATGTLDLDGNVELKAFRTRQRGEFLSLADVIFDTLPIIPEDAGLPMLAGLPMSLAEGTGIAGDFMGNYSQYLRSLQYDYAPPPLFGFDEEVPVYEGVLFSFFGLADIRVSISLGLAGEVIMRGNIRPLAPAVDVTVTPELEPRLDVSLFADAACGVLRGGVTTVTSAELRTPVRMNTDDERLIWLEDPCMRIQSTAYFWLRVNLLFTGQSWSLSPIELVDYTAGQCIAPVLLHAAPELPRFLAAPHVAAGPEGRLLAVYIDDAAPDAAIPQVQVTARRWNPVSNGWDAPEALTPGDRAVHDPVAAFVGPDGHALVVWTQNTLSIAEEEAIGDDLNAILRRQEIFYRYWNGEMWEPAQQLTDSGLPDGLSALAADEGGAVLAWVRDADGDSNTRDDWQVVATHWQPESGSWSEPQILGAFSGSGANYQVSAARRAGRSVLAWTADADGNLDTGNDRQIAIAEWIDDDWSIARPGALGTAVESPSIDLSAEGDRLYLAFLRQTTDATGNTTGIGNQARLWTAYFDGDSWEAAQVLDEDGAPVRAEMPRLALGPDDEPLVIFRRFGAPGTNSALGQLAATRLDQATAAPPLDLTDQATEIWMPAFAIDTESGAAHILHVEGHGTAPAAAPGLDNLGPAGLHGMQLSQVLGGVTSRVLPAGADPSLEPRLAFSQPHAQPGMSVTVTATVRNLGRGTASDVVVRLYSGTPTDESAPVGDPEQEIGRVDVGMLAFNASHPVTFEIQATGGSQPLYAIVTNGDNLAAENTDRRNDVATGNLGEVLPPMRVTATPAGSPETLVIGWEVSRTPDTSGYRVWRSTQPGGPYMLVGETASTRFVDPTAAAGLPLFYVVQSFDRFGELSVWSNETGAVALAPQEIEVDADTIYVPAVTR